MAFTADNTLGSILDQKPGALDVLRKHAGPGAAMLESQLAMVRGMTITQIAGFARWSPEAINALLADLNAL